MQSRLSLTIVLVVATTSLVGAVAPGAPQSLAAAVNGNTVTLTWVAPSTGGAPSSYVVEASLSPNGAVIASFTVTSTSLVVNSVPNGVYYARVRAVNADGSSPPSNEVIVVVPGSGNCAAPPNAPASLTSSVFGMLVTLNWLAPAGACAAGGYVIQAGSAPALSDIAVINVGATTTLSVQAPPGTYYVRVVALNGFGGSPPSNEVVITVTTAPPNLAGFWSGTGTYFNHPFTFNLTQNGNQISGTYQDQHDLGFVSGTVNIGSVILDVNFGDTGIRYEGSIENANRIRGIVRGSVIGGPYTFVMTR
jgi:predicted phage tail protein